MIKINSNNFLLKTPYKYMSSIFQILHINNVKIDYHSYDRVDNNDDINNNDILTRANYLNFDTENMIFVITDYLRVHQWNWGTIIDLPKEQELVDMCHRYYNLGCFT